MEEILFNAKFSNGYNIKILLESFSQLNNNLVVILSLDNIKFTIKNYGVNLGQGEIDEWIYDEDILGKHHTMVLFNFTFLDKIKDINVNNSVIFSLIRGKEGLMIDII